MANPIVERYTRNNQRQTEARRRPGGATRDSISIGARYDPGRLLPGVVARIGPGALSSLVSGADGLASECPGQAHPTTGLRKNASDAAGVTRLQTGERPRPW